MLASATMVVRAYAVFLRVFVLISYFTIPIASNDPNEISPVSSRSATTDCPLCTNSGYRAI